MKELTVDLLNAQQTSLARGKDLTVKFRFNFFQSFPLWTYLMVESPNITVVVGVFFIYFFCYLVKLLVLLTTDLSNLDLS